MSTIVRHRVALAGRVVDDDEAAPLPGARVELVSAPAAFVRRAAAHAVQYGGAWDQLAERPDRTRTDVRGRFRLMDLPDGDYGLAVSLPAAGSRYGTRTANATVTRNAGGDVQLTFMELVLPATSIVGTVVDADAKPVALATVLIADGSGRTFTDKQGRYALSAVQAGPRRILVRARGFAPAERPADVTVVGARVTVNFALTT